MAKTKKARAARAAKGGPSKTAFVKSLPADLSAGDVIAKAKEAGLTISKNYVYLIRSKAKSGGASKAVGRPRGRRTAVVATSQSHGSIEARFTNLVAEIGLARAEELLRAVRTKFVAAH